MRFDTVLLPIDVGNAASWRKALPMAREMAGELHVLGIVHDIGSALVEGYLPEGFTAHAIDRMQADLDAFAAENAPGAVPHVGHGHVPETILRVAGEIGADLIVMASHPPDELRTLLVGSNAAKVVRHADVPVLVVR